MHEQKLGTIQVDRIKFDLYVVLFSEIVANSWNQISVDSVDFSSLGNFKYFYVNDITLLVVVLDY